MHGGVHKVKKTRHLAIVITAVAIVLGIGAVSAYATLGNDATPPVTTSDAVATYWNGAVVNLTATDADGVAYIYHRLDKGVARLYTVPAGGAATATTSAPADRDRPLSAGTHTITFWAQDVNGNVETQHTVTVTVKSDTSAPVTTATGAVNGAWYRQTVAVHLAAADDAAGSGVAMISWALDGAAPTIVPGAAADAGLTVDASTVNGAHTLAFQAVDVAQNAEAPQTLTIKIDTVRPTTQAPYATTVARGRTAALKYKAADAAPNSGKATVVIKIKNHAGKVVKSLNVGKVAVNVLRTRKFTCTLARGTYRFSVFATDAAGNTQVRAASNKLVVK